MFHIMAQPKTNCVFRTFRVKESFWVKKQSCITLKVGIKKWRLFFDFVCFSGCQFFSLSLRKRPCLFKNLNPYFLTTTYPSIGKYDHFSVQFRKGNVLSWDPCALHANLASICCEKIILAEKPRPGCLKTRMKAETLMIFFSANISKIPKSLNEGIKSLKF